METLNILVELQENYNRLFENNKILKDGSNIYLLRKLKREFEMEKQIYIDKKSSIEKIKLKYEVISEKLKSEQIELDKNEHGLYNDSGNNLKLIDSFQTKIEASKVNQKKLEDEAVTLLEKEETIKAEIEGVRVQLVNLKDNFNSFKEKVNHDIINSENEVKIAKENIEKLEKQIPIETLDKFNQLILAKQQAVVKLKGDVCTGCRVKVSAMTIDSLSKKNELVHCDNCGRIVYLP